MEASLTYLIYILCIYFVLKIAVEAGILIRLFHAHFASKAAIDTLEQILKDPIVLSYRDGNTKLN